MKQEKTVKEWLMELPNGYRERAFAMEDQYWDINIAESMSSAIGRAFLWSASKEGEDFWNDVGGYYNGDRLTLPPLPNESTQSKTSLQEEADEIFGDDPLKRARATIEMQQAELDSLRSQVTEKDTLIEKLRWVPMSERGPTKEDADCRGMVQIMELGGRVCQVYLPMGEQIKSMATWWRSCAFDTVSAPKDPIREEFEQWAKDNEVDVSKGTDGYYFANETKIAFGAWKAAKGY